MTTLHLIYRAYLLLLLTLGFLGADAYTWSFEGPPSQCGQLTVAVSGSDGTPPFRLLVVPFGPSLLPDGVEPRSVLDMPFPGNQNSIQFQLTYAENSQFVAVVSDASGFASGGTSVTTTVASSNDSSCFTTAPAPLDFFFYISTVNQVVQCQDLRIWWDPTTVQGTPIFLGLIPGGQSYVLPEGMVTADPTGNMGTGFSWLPNMRAGTTFLLVGGDARGNGTGGAVTYVIAEGDNDESCLSDSGPSSTPGIPAGSSAASTFGPSSTTESDAGGGATVASVSSSVIPGNTAGAQVTAGQPASSDNSGAIIGGAAGGVLALIVLVVSIICCCFCSQRARARARDEERDRTATVHQYQQYQPTERFEPYRPPPPPPPPLPEQDGAQDVHSPEPSDGAAGGTALKDQDGAPGADNSAADRDVVREIEDARDIGGLEPDGGAVGSDTPRETGNDMSVAEASPDERDGSDALAGMEVEQFGLQDGAGPAPEEVVLNQSRETDEGRSNGVSA